MQLSIFRLDATVFVSRSFLHDTWIADGCPNKHWTDFYSEIRINVSKSARWVVFDTDTDQAFGFRNRYDAELFMRFWGCGVLFAVFELI